jgi:hypothetical protein
MKSSCFEGPDLGVKDRYDQNGTLTLKVKELNLVWDFETIK